MANQTTSLQCPVNIPIMNNKGTLSPEWRQFFNSLTQFVQSFQNVVPVPPLTTDEISHLSNVSNGNILCNNTTNQLLVRLGGITKTIQTS